MLSRGCRTRLNSTSSVILKRIRGKCSLGESETSREGSLSVHKPEDRAK